MTKSPPKVAEQLLGTIPLLFTTIRSIVHSLDLELSHHQFRVMKMIHKRPETMKTLATSIHMSPPTLSATVDDLVEQKLVERKRSEKDRRVIHVTLSPSGQKLMDKVFKEACAALNTHLSSMTASEASTVNSAMDILKKHLQN